MTKRALLLSMAQGLTAEQYVKMQEYIESLSDNEFLLLQEEAKKHNDGWTLKEHINMAREIADENGVTPENTAFNSIGVQFLTEQMNDWILEKLSISNPSDNIKLTRDSDSKLTSLWTNGNKTHVVNDKLYIPSDLFFAETIPLMDCKIIIDERGHIINGMNGIICKYRVSIFDDYKHIIDNQPENDVVIVGAVIMEWDEVNGNLFLPICVTKGIDFILFGGVGWNKIRQSAKDNLSKNKSLAMMQQWGISMLETWYGIQIALLHPTVREVFKNPKTIPEHKETNTNKKKRKNKVRYVKSHVLDPIELDKLIYGETQGDKKTIKRQALVWYVIGHWRTYKDGKKVFVQPYWKGALRELKKAMPEREREIAQVV